ncbi:mucin-5AC [Ochotona princeps]|uniref:mucin-5AC n=1 Tax=Ochotona princeps TaxID=9978 RepID=UPI002715590D|nr:mucin-5AC [Ochotona princeps]
MAVGRRKVAPLWALALALACAQLSGHAQSGSSEPSFTYTDLLATPQASSGDLLRASTVASPPRTIPVVPAPDPKHNGRVCSTWGNFHYKTFDGAVFRFPGLCNYVFSAHCGDAYEDFNIQLRRGLHNGTTSPGRVTMKLQGLVVELTNTSVLVNSHPVQLPFSQSGVFIERSDDYLKVVGKLGLVFMWSQDGSLLLELDSKFANKTCGLCGDFNGNPTASEFLSHNARLSPMEFGNLQKFDGPTEQCQDPAPEGRRNCSTSPGVCEELLNGPLFSGCTELVNVSSYIEACRQDLCLCVSTDPQTCLCHTLAEYSRQCAHAGGLPQDWRGPDLCPRTCPHNMEHHECRSPCADTCSNPERSQVCEDHCVAGCFCPEGLVLDDIGQAGCVAVSQCSCTYNGATYAPGANYSTDCRECTCMGGRWSCQDVPCPGTCSVMGGAHFSTFDERQYTVHGDCSYVLAKSCNSSTFSVLAELRKCGLTDSETCLKSVTLSLGGGHTVVVIRASGEVFVNQIYTQLPVSAANVTIFRPSTFFIIAHTSLGLQLDVQLVPTMQVSVQLEPEFRGLTCGLCGNFNSVQADDFRTMSGVVEGTAAAFVNTFKTQASCPNVKSHFEDPCSLSVENEKFAQHWCSRLTDANGTFAECHTAVNPSTYHSNCLFDTCNCEKSEDCMCAALASYVHACAAKGVLLRGWRDGACTKHVTACPKSMVYHYNISACQPTCRSRSEPDLTCSINFVPVDGCACPEGTFLDDAGKCVEASSCPCYHSGSVVPNGESVHDGGAICTCTQGTLTCIGGRVPAPVCDAPMVFFDCRNATSGATGAGCQKSCHTLDMDCYSSQCVSGCVCPDGLVADGLGGCVAEEDCPCVHNEASYRPGETIWTGCNTCTCENRKWQCSDEPCLATCAVYGDGHYLTFDGRRYTFSGDCQYTLLQDQCGGNSSAQDAFRVVTENVPCGTTGTTCSKAIKIFLGSYELKLSDGKVEVEAKGKGQEAPYTIRQKGIFLVVDTDLGLVLLWDRKTTLFLRLSPEFKGRVCGLCGNFDDNAVNDFTTRSQSVVGDALEFGNSWKSSPSCPDAQATRDACTANPYRKSWAQKQCSILNSATFAACHAHVEPGEYYEACVQDACACDSGGDCECFCTAVAAYAQACHEVGVCVSWRSPDVCPLFCDFYNPEGHCEWHYQPCGAPCMRTCQNPNGECLHSVAGLEGCYPKCPSTAPIFDEDEMKCVSTCPPKPSVPRCHVHGKSYRPGATVPSDENCHSCVCTENGVRCSYDSKACVCTYSGQQYQPGSIIYDTTDGVGGCITARCEGNGTIHRTTSACSPTTAASSTPFAFSTAPPAVSSAPVLSTRHIPSGPVSTAMSKSPRTVPTTVPVTAPTACGEQCLWSPWLDVSRPGRGNDSGDYDTLDNLRAHGYRICQAPREVECRAEDAPGVPLSILGQRVQCSPDVGLSCHNREQASGQCRNYQIRVQCCSPRDCQEPGPATQPTTSSTAQTGGSPAPGITRRTTVTAASATTAPSTTHALSPRSGKNTARTTSSATSHTQETSAGTHEPTPSEPSRVSCVREICNWTQWIDGSYPVYGENGGDFDTFQNLRAKGYKFCKTPSNVQCRAAFFPNTPLDELEQVVTCNREIGLLCLNKDQLPPICYNYEIRIQCCDIVDDCRGESTVHTETESSTATPTTRTRGMPSPTQRKQNHHYRDSKINLHDQHRDNLRAEEHPYLHFKNHHNLNSDNKFNHCSHGGDRETYDNILSHGEKICQQPEHIRSVECRAESYHDVSIERLGQVVRCDPDVGLVCHNRDQEGAGGMCLNYEVRVLCCEMPQNCPPTTTPEPTTTTTSTHSQTTSSKCQPQCSWTKWFDVDFPTPGSHGGDRETYDNILSHGEKICQQPEHIRSVECRAESYHDVSIERLGQVVRCDPDVGLVCHNRDQEGAGGMCLNYEVRVLCCEMPQNCPPTTTPEPTTTSTTHRTSSVGTGTSPSMSHTETTSKPSTTHTTMSGTSSHGGDRETYDNILSHGEKICQQPEHIRSVECRAESYHDVSIERLGQVVRCDPDVGLVCHNRDQEGAGGMCLNYEVRVLCCEMPQNCPPTTTPEPTTTRTTSVSHTETTSALRTTHASTAGTTTTSLPVTSSTHASTATSTHSQTTSSKCQPQCSWTKWFDVDFPTPGSHGGDRETYDNILSHGEKICQQPEHIRSVECRAESYHDVSIERLGQVVRCDPDVGLVCHNRDQEGAGGMCLNYEVRVLCCEMPQNCPPTTTPEPTTTSTTHRTSSVGTGTSPSMSHTETTSKPSTTHTTMSGTRTTSVSHTETTSALRTTHASTAGTTTTSLPVTSSTHASTATSTHSQTTSSKCQPQCSWTKWFDVDFPTPGSHGGDRETYDNILSHGEKICQQPEHIRSVECRAESYHDVSIERLGQVVRCDPDVGLVCHNRDQEGAGGMCLNYEVRVLCCEMPQNCPPTTTPEPTTTSTTHRTSSVGTGTSPSMSHTETTSKPSSHGGDRETYDNILSHGEKICQQPEHIRSVECRAESYHDVSIERLGQVVRCDPDVGLVCHNRDQEGAGGMCLNYEVRVLCCEMPQNCPPTTTPEPTTTSSHGGDRETYDNILSHGEKICQRPEYIVQLECRAESYHDVSIERLGQVVRCDPDVGLVCHNRDQEGAGGMCLNYEGSVIYSHKDLDGHCYSAYCSQDCQVNRTVDQQCPPTTSPATTTVSSSTPTSEPPPGCHNTIPPRKKGEIWQMPNCSQAKCNGHNSVSVYPRQCPDVAEPTCANGYPPLKVPNDDGCCYHYQCQCVCSGWGDPHYLTFDGTYYTFLDNCTYVLMQQITPVFGHLRVLIDNYYCDDAGNAFSCPRSITLEYQDARVVLTRRPVNGVMTNQVIFNGKVVSPSFQRDGIVITRVGIKMYATIPKLGVQVMFTGLIFSVQVPYSTFANNTEGQCGTCTNNKEDECRLPGGKVNATCSSMAHHWRVPDQSCPVPPVTPTAVSTTAHPCPKSPICELLFTRVFESCHSTIPPMPFYEGCVFDHCHVSQPDVVCSSLELYASLCASYDICVDWRSHTNGTCPFTCPADKVYQACGPANPPYCYGNDSAILLTLPEAGPITEGCFCPESMTLFSTDLELCVPSDCSRCLSPSGEPMEPGDTITNGCHECTCDSSSLSLSCQPVSCPSAPLCKQPGFVAMPMAAEPGTCCPSYNCSCDPSYCPEPMDCPAGSLRMHNYEDPSCCPSYWCRWHSCSINGTLYEPSSLVPSAPCKTCRCEVSQGPGEFSTFWVNCEEPKCPTECLLGFEYRKPEGQCCGECVQVYCTVSVNNSSTLLYHPGESWPDPKDACVSYQCEQQLDKLVVVTIKESCPPLSCPYDQALLSKDGCCHYCPPPPSQNMSTCTLHHEHQVIQHEGCNSSEPVQLAYCRGNCGDSSSKYSLAASMVEHQCSCCQELRTSPRTVTLHCADGASRNFTYTEVEECGCHSQQCPSPADSSHLDSSGSAQWSLRPGH